MALWGSLKKDSAIPESRFGNGQGYFRYYKDNGKFETIVAVNGRLILDGGDLAIQGLPSGFQTERMIEAVQWKNILFIATGTKLVEYDGIVAKVVEDYKPLPLEYLYVGSNALAAFPDNFMSDGVHDNLRIEGIVPDLRKGITNQPTKFTAFISKPESMGQIEYKWEYKIANRDTFILGRDWSSDKTWTFTPKDLGDYVIQLSARGPLPVSGAVPDPEISQIPVYKVTPFNENKVIDTSQMHTCNRIILHWERLIMYGDQKNTSRIYISHVNNPRYYPTNHSLDFENNEQEPLQKLVQYRDMIVAFMPSSIQALYGKAPIGDEPYRRVVIHTGLGCIAPESPKVLGNWIVFLSREGIHLLKTIGTVDDKMNVEKIDLPISNQIPLDTDAAAIVYDNQYHICFPKKQTRFRFYMDYRTRPWTKDVSPLFDFCRFYEWNGDLVAQSQLTGKTYLFDETVYDDAGHEFQAKVAFKKYDFGEPHNPKKLKEQQLILTNESSDKNVNVAVYGDDNLIIGPEEVEMISTINELTNITKIPLAPEDKVRTVQTVVTHTKAEPLNILAVGYKFKTKKP